MTCIIVAGIHRSGSSAVAGVLHRLGVHMGGPFLKTEPDNPRGYYEDDALVAINRHIVQWRDPSSYKFLPKDNRRYLHYVLRRKRDLWGVKDPRLCFTLGQFARALERAGEDYAIMRVRRHLKHSISSLADREGWPRDLARDVLKAHRQALEQNLERYEATEVRYDDLIDHTKQTIEELVEKLGLDPNEGQMANAVRFVDPDLRHYG